MIDGVDLREPNDNHETGLDAVEAEVDAKPPDGSDRAWEEEGERPLRGSDADAQAPHSEAISGSNGDALTRPL